MILPLIAAALWSMPSMGAAPLRTPGGGCPAPALVTVSGTPGLAPQTLASLPPAIQMRAVLRSVGPCAVLEVYRAGSGWTLHPAGDVALRPEPATPPRR